MTVVRARRGRVERHLVLVVGCWGTDHARGDGWHQIEDPYANRANRLITSVCPAEEGVRWIRGHHTPADLEGKALLAAYALANDFEPPRVTYVGTLPGF